MRILQRLALNARLLTTHTPSAIGPTLNYFVSIYFERTIFADFLKKVFNEVIESKLNEVDSSCITKKRRVCSSYTQLWSFCYTCVEFNKDVSLPPMRGNVGDTL